MCISGKRVCMCNSAVQNDTAQVTVIVIAVSILSLQ